MGAHKTAALGGMLVLTAGLLLGCGSGGDSGPTTPALSAAESLMGAALLPPDGVVGAADVLGSDELPPDGSATAVVADDDQPPAG